MLDQMDDEKLMTKQVTRMTLSINVVALLVDVIENSSNLSGKTNLNYENNKNFMQITFTVDLDQEFILMFLSYVS